MELPDDLAEHWHLTDWSLALNAWDLHIAFATYPPPACFEQARIYEAKAAEQKTFGAAARKPARKKRPKAKEQLELW